MKLKAKTNKDLGIKIGTEKESFWTQVKQAAEMQVKDAEKTIMLQREVANMAELQIKKEKALNSSKTNTT